MKSHIEKYFSAADVDRIIAAVKEAESKTSAEVVPYVVPRSDEYEEATWRGATLAGSLTLLAFVLLNVFTEVWLSRGVVEAALLTLGASLAGAALCHFVPPLKRFFSGKELMEHRVEQRAANAFLAEEVFNTRDRTGVLLFLSLLERRVVVLGDAGINAKVRQSDWDEIVKTITKGMEDDRPAAGLVEAIRQCGGLLQRHGVMIRDDDRDELGDKLRTSET